MEELLISIGAIAVVILLAIWWVNYAVDNDKFENGKKHKS